MTFRPEAYRILVVDDDPGMRLAMVETLKRKKYQVDSATDGTSALTKVTQHAYQALVTDMRMPGMTGMELLHQVKKVSPATEVLLVTAFGTVASAVEAMKVGAYDYLQKPFSTQDLERLIYNALVKNQPENAFKATDATAGSEIVTKSPKMKKILEIARRTAKSNVPVLVQAESGTGKELIARYICQNSDRAGKAVVAINCAALPDNLLESELFGYEKGSFTGALHSKPGKFEMADGGTIILDEIGEMPMSLQAKLLRVLQEQEVDRIGSKQPIKIDVRVIALTNRDLKQRIQQGAFREDLYFRLNVIPMELPKLADRPEDIEVLCKHFIDTYSDEAVSIATSAMSIMRRYPWPGNVRELENLVRRALLLRQSNVLEVSDLFQFGEEIGETPPADMHMPSAGLKVVAEDDGRPGILLQAGTTVAEMERKLIELTLEDTENNKTQAAKLLGISLRTLRNKLNEYKKD